MKIRTSAVIAMVLLAGCTPSKSTATSPSAVAPATRSVATTVPTTVPTTSASTTTTAVAVTTTTIGPDVTQDRPYEVFVPTKYNSATPMPLVVMLHGYIATGALQEGYFKLQPLAEERGFLYVHPDGTQAVDGAHFWNATDACCNFRASTVDDSAYLLSIIEQVQLKYNVDPKRIFLMGHSNGGFMSHRMACDHADKIAAIASLAGAMWNDVSKCSPSSPINVLQIHGTDDELVKYGGGVFAAPFPSAEVTTSDWAKLEGCGAQPVVQPSKLDLDRELPGAETTSYVYGSCTAGGSATLWSIAGGKHSPHLSDTFSAQVIDYLFAHPKP